jgi:hypothetical protein
MADKKGTTADRKEEGNKTEKKGITADSKKKEIIKHTGRKQQL